MPRVLLGICGQKGSGKDTICDFIEEWGTDGGLTTCTNSFANKVKHSAALALGFQVEEQDAIVLMDELKTNGEVTTIIPGQSVGYTISGRSYLQLYGVEAHRELFGEDFWLDQLLPIKSRSWAKNFDYADICLVSDVRFDNEAERIKQLGGYIWKVKRPDLPYDTHLSEEGISEFLIDKTIHNIRDLDSLKKEVIAMLYDHFGHHTKQKSG